MDLAGRLKVLVISNFYPPHHIGGYELGCSEVVQALRARGHHVRVLTSAYGRRRPGQEDGVDRILRLTFRPTTPPLAVAVGLLATLGGTLLAKEIVNQARFGRALAEFCPDVVHVWNLSLASVSLALIAQTSGVPVAFFVSDSWLSRWEKDLWYSIWNASAPLPVRCARELLRPLARAFGLVTSGSLALEEVQTVSAYLRDELLTRGKKLGNAEVAPWGADPERYPCRSACDVRGRLLYVGQVVPHKGLHVAIEAVRQIRNERPREPISLTVVGGTIRPKYERSVRRLVHESGLDGAVHFLGFLPRERVAVLYREHDVLLFPSIWDEPFSLTVVEAMASGLPVVATHTGGTPEIIEHGENGMLVPRDDAGACAAAATSLLHDRELYRRISGNARATVARRFRIEHTVDLVETSLRRASSRPRPAHR